LFYLNTDHSCIGRERDKRGIKNVTEGLMVRGKEEDLPSKAVVVLGYHWQLPY
jgi:hypothetical protein